MGSAFAQPESETVHGSEYPDWHPAPDSPQAEVRSRAINTFCEKVRRSLKDLNIQSIATLALRQVKNERRLESIR